MYEYINGQIAELTPTYVVVEAGGVGYYMIISLHTFSELEARKEAKVYTHYIVREDTQILHGFSTKQERELFRALIGVSGVGGATARMVLSTYTPEETVNIIATENARLLSNVKGLGKKTSEKIIIELRDKVSTILYPANSAEAEAVGKSSAMGTHYEEAMGALTMLGFTKKAADKALRNVFKEQPKASVEEIIRLALKSL